MATIHEAARAGDVVALLSSLDTDPLSLNARDRHSRTPYPVLSWLHLASWAGHADVVHTLCKKHADVGATAADNMAAIHFASQKGHIQVVRCLLTAGASVNACTRKGVTPLHYAIQGGHLDVALLLIKKGANLHAQNKAGKKAIDLAKNEEFRRELLVAEAERQEAKAANKKSKSKGTNIASESSIGPELAIVASEKDGQIEDSTKDGGGLPECVMATEKGDQIKESTNENCASPPRKRSKVQLSHLGMEQETGSLDEENS